MRRLLIGTATALGFILAVSAVPLYLLYRVGAAFDPGPDRHASDAQMIAHWRAHRPAFERLAAMMTENSGLRRIAMDRTEPEDPMSYNIKPERIALYRALFRELGIVSAQTYAESRGKQIDFTYDRGIYRDGGVKSFWHGPPSALPQTVDGDIDAAAAKLPHPIPHASGLSFQRHIEGDWWLHYEIP